MTFQTGGHGPSIFLTVLFLSKKKKKKKNASINMLMRKIVHQIASFKPTFSKKLQLLRGPHRHPPARASAALTRHFYFQKSPPPLKIFPPPMTGVEAHLQLPTWTTLPLQWESRSSWNTTPPTRSGNTLQCTVKCFQILLEAVGGVVFWGDETVVS